jgi:hypothetical protein
MLLAGRDGIETLIKYGGNAADFTLWHHGIGARPFVVPDACDLLYRGPSVRFGHG